MGESNYNEYYKEKLEKALIFQDFVMEILHSHGITIMNYGSKKYQHEKGENLAGIEIKYDEKYEDTGNLYIEISEKSHPSNMSFVSSGIYRNDNSWLYVMGNYNILYMFGKKTLIKLHKTKRYIEVISGTKTSKGFLFPKPDAIKYALKIIDIAEKAN